MQLWHISSLGIGTQKVNWLAVNELSALAWDEHKKLLYAVSDSGILDMFSSVVLFFWACFKTVKGIIRVFEDTL